MNSEFHRLSSNNFPPHPNRATPEIAMWLIRSELCRIRIKNFCRVLNYHVLQITAGAVQLFQGMDGWAAFAFIYSLHRPVARGFDAMPTVDADLLTTGSISTDIINSSGYFSSHGLVTCAMGATNEISLCLFTRVPHFVCNWKISRLSFRSNGFYWEVWWTATHGNLMTLIIYWRQFVTKINGALPRMSNCLLFLTLLPAVTLG